jgi:hypothetical protein
LSKKIRDASRQILKKTHDKLSCQKFKKMKFIEGHNWGVGVGYVKIPSDLERDRYVGLCYRTNTICIGTDDGGFFPRVPCNPELLNHIEFPKSSDEVGSAVLYINEPIKNQLFVITRLEKNNILSDGKEGYYKIQKRWKEGEAELILSGKEGFAGITVNKPNEGGKLLLRSSGGVESSLELESEGDLEIKGKKIIFNTWNETRIETQCEEDKKIVSFVQNGQENRFEGDKFIIGQGCERMVLGEKLKSFLDDFIDEISKITVTTALGVQPILNISQIFLFKNRTAEILSQIGYIE